MRISDWSSDVCSSDLRDSGDGDAALFPREIDADLGQRERVAERDEIGGAFCGHDPGDARGREDVALGSVAAADRFEGLWRHTVAASGARAALRRGLGADIDHMLGSGCFEIRRSWCSVRGAKQRGAGQARGYWREQPQWSRAYRLDVI